MAVEGPAGAPSLLQRPRVLCTDNARVVHPIPRWGGRRTVESRPGAGTRVPTEVPLPAEDGGTGTHDE
jgi:hypothetical protein